MRSCPNTSLIAQRMMNPVTPQQSDPIIGQIGTYRVEAEIDAAEMGVYLAKDHAWRVCGTESAVALLGPPIRSCDEFLKRQRRCAGPTLNDL